MIHKEITRKIIGSAFQVHSFLGNGFQEVIYQRALGLEMSQKNLNFQRELSLDIFYKEFHEPIGTRRVDFLVENKVLVEIKAISRFEDVHFTQLLNYLRVYKLELGLLINFGERKLYKV